LDYFRFQAFNTARALQGNALATQLSNLNKILAQKEQVLFSD
jgi:hypothetical protein